MRAAMQSGAVPESSRHRHQARGPRTRSATAWMPEATTPPDTGRISPLPERFPSADLDAHLLSQDMPARPDIDDGIYRDPIWHLDAVLPGTAEEAPSVAQDRDAIAHARGEGAPGMAGGARGTRVDRNVGRTFRP